MDATTAWGSLYWIFVLPPALIISLIMKDWMIGGRAVPGTGTDVTEATSGDSRQLQLGLGG